MYENKFLMKFIEVIIITLNKKYFYGNCFTGILTENDLLLLSDLLGACESFMCTLTNENLPLDEIRQATNYFILESNEEFSAAILVKSEEQDKIEILRQKLRLLLFEINISCEKYKNLALVNLEEVKPIIKVLITKYFA
ncbi:MAG: hypothetical protein EAX96_16115 [Candidatus Lokiarchaeota archaeon]|nr:hypothetical protein [Candidatus Lokiarchaeota archaeon]